MDRRKLHSLKMILNWSLTIWNSWEMWNQGTNSGISKYLTPFLHLIFMTCTKVVVL